MTRRIGQNSRAGRNPDVKTAAAANPRIAPPGRIGRRSLHMNATA